MSIKDRLMERTCKIIDNGGIILLKRLDEWNDEWYLGSWTNIAGGIDHVSWSSREGAQEISDLEWAFGLAKLYNCKVVSFYPHRVK